MPGRLDEKIIAEVEKFLAKEKYATKGKKLSATQLRNRYKDYFRARYRHNKNYVGKTKFIEIFNEREKRRTEPFPWIEWKPWATPEESAEDRAFLLQMNAVKLAETGGVLTPITPEAEWARRLRVALDGLNPFGQFNVVVLYSFREYVAKSQGISADTSDLDSLIAYKPWLPDNRIPEDQPSYVAYLTAIEAGIATYPELDPFHDIREPEPEAPELAGMPETEQPSEVYRQVREVYLRETLRRIFTPHGIDRPDEQRERLDRLLNFWAGLSQ